MCSTCQRRFLLANAPGRLVLRYTAGGPADTQPSNCKHGSGHRCVDCVRRAPPKINMQGHSEASSASCMMSCAVACMSGEACAGLINVHKHSAWQQVKWRCWHRCSMIKHGHTQCVSSAVYEVTQACRERCEFETFGHSMQTYSRQQGFKTSLKPAQETCSGHRACAPRALDSHPELPALPPCRLPAR